MLKFINVTEQFIKDSIKSPQCQTTIWFSQDWSQLVLSWNGNTIHMAPILSMGLDPHLQLAGPSSFI